MFHAWKQEKATAALVDEAQALAEKLADTKAHIVDSYGAHARVWAVSALQDGKDLHALALWPAAAVARFISATQTKIAALRKARDYDSSDGLAVWLHTARAVKEPRIAPAVRQIWRHLLAAGPNCDAMALDLLQDAGLPLDQPFGCPKGFDTPE